MADSERKMKEGDRVVFPLSALVPKTETQVDQFLQHHGTYDGRGVVVAIFDTGVDPGAPGLEVTTDAKKKIIDCIDGSGSGDVDCSKEVTADKDLTVKGLSGRTLFLGKDWKNPAGKYRLGLKRAYELFPQDLTKRLVSERQKNWDRTYQHREATLFARVADLETQTNAGASGSKQLKDELKQAKLLLETLQAMQKNFDDPGPMYDCVVWHDGEVWRAVVDTTETGRLEGLPALADYCKEHQYATLGGESSKMNFSVNIYNEGRLLCLVTTAGAHGTHVAGIVGAYYPDQPALNGIAPGCQMISVKIGDSRLGSMETGAGLTRALTACLENNCDLINMSYGEAVAIANTGRFGELSRDLIDKHGVIFVSSAGNAGPALSTVGSPGGTEDGLIGIGAYVSEAMMETQYSQIEPASAENHYTWSSRGPSYDGALGVSVSACGGAITSVPRWTLQQSQLKNGTSMSSPATCGALALLLSAAKAQHVPRSPVRIKRAIENTARPIKNADVHAQGQGLLQLLKAYKYLIKHASRKCEDIGYTLDVHNSALRDGRTSWHGSKGVYLRSAGAADLVHLFNLTVTPKFPQHLHTLHPSFSSPVSFPPPWSEHKQQLPPSEQPLPDAARTVEHNTGCMDCMDVLAQAKLDFQVKIRLQATADWVTCPAHTLMNSDGREFSIRVDPTQLAPGTHFAEVLGFDSEFSEKERGPLFRVPITVCKPVPASSAVTCPPAALSLPPEPDDSSVVTMYPLPALQQGAAAVAAVPPHLYDFPSLALEAGRLVRHFFTVPATASLCHIKVRGLDLATPRHFVLHASPLQPQVPHRDRSKHVFFSLQNAATRLADVQVRPGELLEVVLAQYWSSSGVSVVSLSVAFTGPWPSVFRLVMDGNQGGTARVDLANELAPVMLCPKLELTTLQQAVRPAGSLLHALPARSVRPARCLLPGVASGYVPQHLYECETMSDGKFGYELLLEYNWTANSKVKVTPRMPLLNGYLYESAFDAQFWMLFDDKKRLVGSGDCWPEAVEVAKGSYLLRLSIRHSSISSLEPLQNAIMLFETPLEKKLSLSAYSCYNNCLTRSSAISGRGMSLPRASVVPVWFKGPQCKDLPKHSKERDVLLGTVSYVKDTADHDTSTVASFPAAYTIPTKANSKKKVPEVTAAASAGPVPPAQPSAADAGAKGAKTKKKPSSKEKDAGALAKADAQDVAATASSSEAQQQDTEEEKEGAEEDADLAIGWRDAQIKWIKGLKDGKAQKAAWGGYGAALLATWPTHLPLLTLQMDVANKQYSAARDDKSTSPEQVAALRAEVLAAADAVVGSIDTHGLAAFCFLHPTDKEEVESLRPAKRKEHKEKTAQKDGLLAALETKAVCLQHALLLARPDLSLTADPPARPTAPQQQPEQQDIANRFREAVEQLAQWKPLKDKKNVEKTSPLALTLELLDGNTALLLKAYNAKASAGDLKPAEEAERIVLLRHLGWIEWAEYFDKWQVLARPPHYTLH
eukprot:g4430.t1